MVRGVHEKILSERRNLVVLSFGIGNDISFDLELIRNFDATVYAFDSTPMRLDWLKTQNPPERFVAFPIGVAAVDGEIELGLPQQEGVFADPPRCRVPDSRPLSGDPLRMERDE